MIVSFVGRGRSGKDTAAKWFHSNTTLRFRAGHSCSRILLPYMAPLYPELSEEEVFETRLTERRRWYEKGRELQETNPLFLVEKLLEDCDIIVGIRTEDEINISRQRGLVDLHVWVEREIAYHDPTMEFGPDLADLVLLNNGTEDEFHRKLERLAYSLGVVRRKWICDLCDYDNLEAKTIVDPVVCPICAEDNGTNGRIVGV